MWRGSHLAREVHETAWTTCARPLCACICMRRHGAADCNMSQLCRLPSLINRMACKEMRIYFSGVFVFIEALVCLENNANLDATHMDGGGRARKARRSGSIIHDRNIKSLTRDLEFDIFHNRARTISNFLTRASELTHATFEEMLNPPARLRWLFRLLFASISMC